MNLFNIVICSFYIIQLQLYHATYQDLLRRWQHHFNNHLNTPSSPSLLDSLVCSSSSLSAISLDRNCFDLRSSANGLDSIKSSSLVHSQDAIMIENFSSNCDETYNWTLPLLRFPTLITASSAISSVSSNHLQRPLYEAVADKAITIHDTSLDVFHSTSQASRRHIDLRFKLQEDIVSQMTMLMSSKKYHSSSSQPHASSERVFSLGKTRKWAARKKKSSKDINLAFFILVTPCNKWVEYYHLVVPYT